MIAWDQIAAECDGYKAGFVAVFRRYEGQPTDEKDARGRTVKVTATSFADHAGLSVTTLRRWMGARSRATTPSDRPAMAAARMVRTPEDREALVREIAKVDPAAVETVYRDRYPRPAPRTPLERKESAAWAESVTAPLTDAIDGFVTGGVAGLTIEELNEMADALAEVKGRITAEVLTGLRAAHKRVGDEIDVLAWRSDLEESER